ncbi:hypothetical protein D3C80_1489680 [compost metagenome]
MHPPAQFQADVTLERDGVGTDLHFLIGGDARVGTVQIRRTDAASGQQCFAGQALCLEGIEYQGDGIEGGEVGVEHGSFQPWDSWNAASCMPRHKTVGASLLAMVVNDNAGSLTPRGDLLSIASRLAPTGVLCGVSSIRRRGRVQRDGEPRQLRVRLPASHATCQTPPHGSCRHRTARQRHAGGCPPRRHPASHRLHGIG